MGHTPAAYFASIATEPRPATTEALTAWLTGLPGVSEVRPLALQIGRPLYPVAARYRQTRPTHAGTPAYLRGERAHTTEVVYVVGPLPASYRRDRRKQAVYRLPADDRDWYVAGYYPATLDASAANVYQPFGANFMLMAWEVPSGERIDRYETPLRERITVRVATVPTCAGCNRAVPLTLTIEGAAYCARCAPYAWSKHVHAGHPDEPPGPPLAWQSAEERSA